MSCFLQTAQPRSGALRSQFSSSQRPAHRQQRFHVGNKPREESIRLRHLCSVRSAVTSRIPKWKIRVFSCTCLQTSGIRCACTGYLSHIIVWTNKIMRGEPLPARIKLTTATYAEHASTCWKDGKEESQEHNPSLLGSDWRSSIFQHEMEVRAEQKKGKEGSIPFWSFHCHIIPYFLPRT